MQPMQSAEPKYESLQTGQNFECYEEPSTVADSAIFCKREKIEIKCCKTEERQCKKDTSKIMQQDTT